MLEKLKLFVVTKGDYSDYHVEGIYDTIGAAEERKQWVNSGNEVDVWELNVPVSHTRRVCTEIRKDGTIVGNPFYDYDYDDDEFPVSESYFDSRGEEFVSYVNTDDIETAKKVTIERWTRLVSTPFLWGNNEALKSMGW